MRRARGKKQIDFNYDSLADIVSNILGILIILGVMVGLIVKSEKEVKNNHEKDLINGKRDALSDIIKPDKRLKIPLEREARYNRFHVHVICYQSKLYFVDISELSFSFYKQGYKSILLGVEVGDCKFSMSREGFYQDHIDVKPLEGKGLSANNSSTNNEAFREFFKLMPEIDREEKRAKTQLLPNNHAVHFHVFPDSITVFRQANDYLRMLGFDTGWNLYPQSENGSVKLPAYLQEHQNVKTLFIQ